MLKRFNKKPNIIIEGINPDYDKLINNYIDESKQILIFGAKTPEEAVEKAIKFALKKNKFVVSKL